MPAAGCDMSRHASQASQVSKDVLPVLLEAKDHTFRESLAARRLG
jgi:hypothetical protein